MRSQLSFLEPEVTPLGFNPRSYQREAADACVNGFKNQRRLLLVFFPGAGKTKTASYFLSRVPGRALWLADTDFLLDQARSALEEVTGELTTLEQGPHHMGSERIVIASMQTLRADRLLRKEATTFDWIIVDEAHCVLAPTYRRIIEHFTSAKVLGLSATPFRLDGKKVVGPGGFFDSVVYERTTAWGIAEGYLCPIQPRIREVVEIDLSQVRTHGGDLRLGDLEKQIIKAAAPIAQIAWQESDEGELPAIIYTPGVASAKAVAATFRALAVDKWGPEACVSLDGETPSILRKRIKREFGANIRAVANCNLWTQGADLPRAKCIVMGRKTMSRALFQQMSLRGGRTLIPELPTRDGRIAAIAASEKPWFRLVDLAGNAGKHDLASIADLAGDDLTLLGVGHGGTGGGAGSASAGTAGGGTAGSGGEAGGSGGATGNAGRGGAKNKSPDLGTATDEAKKAAADEQRECMRLQEEEIARAAAAAVVKTVEKSWDPFRKFGIGEFKAEGLTPDWIDQQPTAEQRVWLEKNRMKSGKHTRATVDKLQALESQWRREGKATFNQRRILAGQKLPVDLSFGLASRVLEYIRLCRWNPITYKGKVDKMLRDGRRPGED